MTIELRTFASGDTDYISKLNSNVSAIKAAIDALQAQAGAAQGVNEITVGVFWSTLFNEADTLIGPNSYVPTQGSSTVTVSPGGFYLATTQTPVNSLTPVTLNFSGQTANTYYITVTSSGAPTFSSTFGSGAAYSVEWSGSAFVGQPIRIAQCFFDAAEATASRESTAMGELESPVEEQFYFTLDDRLEAVEEIAVQAKTDAANALDLVYDEGGGVGAVGIRKVGITVDDTTGVKGAIQLDFTGTIIGWSVIADTTGSLTVDISKAVSPPPPAAPVIPNTTTDKISASAPITLSSAQSASSDDDGVSTWDTSVFQWEVIQFNVTAVSGLTRATLYLRIQAA